MCFLVVHLCTYVTSREEKDSFFVSIQEFKAISSLPQVDCFVTLRDFNAEVGSRQNDDNEGWHKS